MKLRARKVVEDWKRVAEWSRAFSVLTGRPCGRISGYAVPGNCQELVASQQDIASFNRLRLAAPATDLTNQILPKLPEFPADVLQRFPSLREHQNKLEEWRVKANIAIRGGTT